MKISRSVLVAFLVISLLPAAADAQYFGRNKVQWEKFDFRILRTEHFDIYYYPEEEPVVQDIGRMAERWYERLSRVFGHTFDRKPIVLYANHPDFQQTTTTRGMIGEGTGGFTDAFLNRVVLPLTPVNADNDHVLGHEMVHVFQFDIANRAAQSPGGRRFNLQQLPLWIIEGLAEYFSQGRVDPQTAMWLRDAAIHDRLPDLKRITRDPRLSPYQFGQGFWAYIGGRWGDDNVTRLFLASAIVGVEEAFPRVLGATAKEVFEGWHDAVRAAYFPIVNERNKPSQMADPIVRPQGREMAISPVITPDGRRVAFLSTRDLFSIGLFVQDIETGRVERLVSEDSDPHFDALRFIDSAGSWSPDGKRLAFVTIEQGDNRLAIVNADSRSVEQRIAVPGIDALSNPAWSPDGSQIAFSGQNNGVSDIYIYNLDTKQVRQVTNDPYSDLQPAWSPDGRTLAFVTDRGAETDLALLEFQSLRLALADLTGAGRIQLLDIFPKTRHINPQFSPDGQSLYFIANPDGISDVFRYSLSGGAVARMTNVATGVAGITDTSPALSVAAAQGDLVFSLFNNGRYTIHRVRPQVVEGRIVAREGGPGRAGILPPLDAGNRETVVSYLEAPTAGLPPRNARYTTRPYDQSLRLSYLGPPTVGVGVDRYGLGLGGSITALWTDILGQHEVGTSIVSGSGGSSFSSSIAGQVYYLNQEQRVHWGGAALHVPYISARTIGFTEVRNIDGQNVVVDVIQQERLIQTIDELSLLSRYPLDLNRRFEANAGYTRFGFQREIEELVLVGNQIVDRDIFDLPTAEAINLFRGAVAFVGDSSFFGFVSPVRGTRYRFEVETFNGDLGFQTALADYRRYFFMRPVTFAVRGLHYGRYGSDAEDERLSQLYIGRGTLVRGYDDISLSECIPTEGSNACPVFDRLTGSKIGVASAEVRLPLVGTEEFGLIRGEFMPVELLGFVDAGVAWTEDEDPELKFDRDTTERVPVFSAGISARILLGGYLPIELYYAWPFQRPNEDAVFGFSIAPGW